MKRLLGSSRFMVAIASVITAVIVAYGGSEERAGHIADLAVDLIKWFGTLWIGATAMEDAAAKLASRGKVSGLGRDAMFGCLMLMLVPGCSVLTPGADTRAALEQRSETVWASDDSLTLKENSTHNRRIVAAESMNEKTGLEMDYYPDGTPKRVSGASHHLSQVTEPRDAASAQARRDELNAQLGLEGIRAARDMMGFLQAQQAVSSVSSDVAALLREREVVEALKRLAPASSPAPR